MSQRMIDAAKKTHSEFLFPEAIPIERPDPTDLALPEPLMISKRICDYLMVQTVLTDDWQLFFGHFHFRALKDVPSDLFPRMGHEWFSRAAQAFYLKPIDNLITFEWQHSTPNSESIIRYGLSGTLERIAQAKNTFAGQSDKLDYLNALEECAHGIIAWAHKCADVCEMTALTKSPERAKELADAAAILRHVPEHPARTFREGVQTVWLCYQFLSDSIGTIDRYLIPLYEKDLKEGRLTREEAKEYLQCLFVMLQAHTDYTATNHNRGGECHFAIGGYLPDGSDGFSDLSRLIVEALMELPMNIPEISLRYTNKTPREVLRFCLDCERHDIYKRIAFVNDEPRIRSFMKNLDMSFEEACRYTMVGCNEPAFPGTVWYGGATVNLARSLTRTLTEGKEKILSAKDFDEFYGIYESFLVEDLGQIRSTVDMFNKIRAKDCNVISSLFIDGCIESATPANRSGCRIKLGGIDLMGLICVVDSLTVIRQFVYEEKRITLGALCDALESNWQSDPDLRTLIFKKADFFGNDLKRSNEIAARLTTSLYNFAKNHRLYGGERIVYGTLAGYNPHYAIFGALTMATPDGRAAGDAFSVGSGQSFGRDREGLTALFSSVAKMDPEGILCGPYVLNVSLDEMLIRNDAYFEKTVDMIDSYFKEGGLHVQLNYVSKEELLRAREMPDEYRNLKVRVSGYSDYFVNLIPEIQQNVIERTVKGY